MTFDCEGSDLNYTSLVNGHKAINKYLNEVTVIFLNHILMEEDCRNTVKETGDLLMVIPLLYTRKTVIVGQLIHLQFLEVKRTSDPIIYSENH